MNVAFVMLHHNKGYPFNEIRQLFVASKLYKDGLKTKVYCLDSNNYSIYNNLFGYECDVVMCPIDEDVLDVHDATSDILIENIIEFSPDILFIKGVDYIGCQILFDKIKCKKVIIAGGVYDHDLIQKADGVLYETEKQMQTYKGDKFVDIFPKFINWLDVSNTKSTKEFDIVNVGTFDEERKAQELLSQLSFYKKIVFVGGGKRLKSFKEIFNRNNVAFTGLISETEVYRIINKSKIMVHSSVWDGYPRAVAQSLACGVPVVGLENVLDGINDDVIRTCPISKLTDVSLEILENEAGLVDLSSKSYNYMYNISKYENILNVVNRMITHVSA